MKTKQFLEVLESPWRSDEASRFLHDLGEMWEGSLTPQEQSNQRFMCVKQRNTHRQLPCIPIFAPFNFAISPTWLEEHRGDPEIGPLLGDWGTHGNPAGFWSAKNTSFIFTFIS
ncbi:hypothetical protein B0H10DRAFT_2186636, partial [Mycena sp. CBHHK59/15]